MEFSLKRVLQALLLSTSEPLAAKDAQKVIARFHEQAATESEEQGEAEGQTWMRPLLEQVPALLTTAQFRDTLQELARDLEAQGSVMRIVEGAEGFRLAVAPELADWVRLWRDEPRPQRLSGPTLETLVIVAYRQPVTRAEIEAIRGVASDSALNRLLERELIEVAGRADLPGRPLQYVTTARFLELCGLRSVEELPASDVLTARQLNQWLEQVHRPPVQSQELGLPLD